MNATALTSESRAAPRSPAVIGGMARAATQPAVAADASSTADEATTRQTRGGDDLLEVTVQRSRTAAKDIRALELVPSNGETLPPAEAGAHIDLHLPDGLIRQYSLMEPATAPESYRIGVLCDPESRGGSSYVVEQLCDGDRLCISRPRNNFALDETATEYVLIAGGIGVTPLVSMARRLRELDRTVTCHYLMRTRERAAFVDELAELLPDDSLHLYVDDEGDSADLPAIIGAPGENRRIYACGPVGLLDAIRAQTSEWPSAQVRFEQFTAEGTAGDPAADSACRVELQRSGHSFTLEADETLLDALKREGVDVPCACTEGICGTCAVEIVEGAVDHRDALQDDEEKAQNDVMYVCVSRPLGPNLILDL